MHLKLPQDPSVVWYNLGDSGKIRICSEAQAGKQKLAQSHLVSLVTESGERSEEDQIVDQLLS
jgi:hypothetical protein